MPKYLVVAKRVEYYDQVVTANSEAEASIEAEVSGNWDGMYAGDFDIDSVVLYDD